MLAGAARIAGIAEGQLGIAWRLGSGIQDEGAAPGISLSQRDARDRWINRFQRIEKRAGHSQAMLTCKDEWIVSKP